MNQYKKKMRFRAPVGEDFDKKVAFAKSLAGHPEKAAVLVEVRTDTPEEVQVWRDLGEALAPGTTAGMSGDELSDKFFYKIFEAIGLNVEDAICEDNFMPFLFLKNIRFGLKCIRSKDITAVDIKKPYQLTALLECIADPNAPIRALKELDDYCQTIISDHEHDRKKIQKLLTKHSLEPAAESGVVQPTKKNKLA